MPTDVTMQSGPEGDQSFDYKKRRYFTKLGLGIRGALRMHKKSGLWGTGEDDWRNVSQHCLVTAARVSVLADTLGFPADEQRTLTTAAGLHDFFKKDEIESFKGGNGMTWDKMVASSDKAASVLGEADFNERILRIISLVGLGATSDATKILQKNNFSEGDLADLLLRYVDIYTIGDSWAEPVVSVDGARRVHPLDARVNKDTLKYPGLNETGRTIFHGEPAYDVFRRNGHDLQARIFTFLQAGGHIPDSMKQEELPYWIDGEIKKRIMSDNG